MIRHKTRSLHVTIHNAPKTDCIQTQQARKRLDIPYLVYIFNYELQTLQDYFAFEHEWEVFFNNIHELNIFLLFFFNRLL